MENNYGKSNYNKNMDKNNSFENNVYDNEFYGESAYGEKTVNAESLNIDTTLNDISKELRPGETLVLDIGNNYFHQMDEIYDTLVMRGYEVKKSEKNGRNQIIVRMKA